MAYDISQLIANGLIVLIIIVAIVYYELRLKQKQKEIKKRIAEYEKNEV